MWNMPVGQTESFFTSKTMINSHRKQICTTPKYCNIGGDNRIWYSNCTIWILPLQRQLGVSLCTLYYELTNLNLFIYFSFYYHQGFVRTNHSIVKCVMCAWTNALREITSVAQIQVMMNAVFAWR